MVFTIIAGLAVIGLLLSLYTIYVERKLTYSKQYKAFCDFHKSASCSKAFSSAYGKTFGVSNGTYGIVFYLLLFTLTLSSFSTYIIYFSSLAVLGSLYLAYVSIFKLKNYCMVCIGVYLVNIMLFLFSWRVIL